MGLAAVIIDQTPVEIQLRQTSSQLCEIAANVVIMDRNDLSEATDLVKQIKGRAKEIEDERTRLVKPFNEGVKQINGRFKSMLTPLEEAEADVKGKMLAFQKDEERKAEEERRRIEAIRLEAERNAQAENPVQAQQIEIAVPKPVMPATTFKPTTYGQTGATSTVKKVWAFELVDIQKLAIARPDLITIDQVKINQEIRGKGGVIDGLRIFEKDVIQVR